MIPWVRFDRARFPAGSFGLWAIHEGGPATFYRYVLGHWCDSTLGAAIVKETGSLVLMPLEVWFSPIQSPAGKTKAAIDNAIDVNASAVTPPQAALPP